MSDPARELFFSKTMISIPSYGCYNEGAPERFSPNRLFLDRFGNEIKNPILVLAPLEPLAPLAPQAPQAPQIPLAPQAHQVPIVYLPQSMYHGCENPHHRQVLP